MARFNRNIITRDDAARVAAVATPAALPAALAASPPSGSAPALNADPARGGVAVPTEDDYLTKLVKYVPMEVLGAYLLIEGVINSNVTKPRDHALWLGGVLLGTLLVAIPYDFRVLGVARGSQVGVSLLGLTIYVFSVGGWFATTTWYHQWYATIALPAFALLVAIIKLKPLPSPG